MMFLRFNLSIPLKFEVIRQLSYSSDTQTALHSIDNMQVIFVLTGNANIDINNNTLELDAGKWLIIPAKENEHIDIATDSDTTIYQIGFSSSHKVQWSNTAFLNENNAYGLTLPQIGQSQNIREISSVLDQLYSASSDPSQTIMATNYLLSTFLIRLSNQFINYLAGNTFRKVPAKFEWILDWMTNHCEDQLTVTAIAEQFDITPTYLTQLFKQYQHVSTITFIHNLKVSKAKDLLITTNLSVKQIAYYLSFQNIKYFMRLFKQETGYTPTNFRNAFAKTSPSLSID